VIHWKPRRRFEVPKPIPAFHDAVVFSGGGNAGAAQVGMVQALLAAGVQPDLFVGCSVGALNAAYLAVEPTPERARALESVWRAVGRGNVFSGNRRTVAAHLLRRHDHLYEPDGLRALIAGAVTVADLAETAVPVHVVTTDLGTGQPAWWSTGDPVEVLAASACLPGIFPPVRLGDSLHVDGGVLCPVPTNRALELGAQRVWVLDVCGTKPMQLSDRPTALDVLLASFSLARRALQMETAGDPAGDQQVTIITCELPPNLDVRDFSRTSELIQRGRKAAEVMASHVELALVG
jgi:NTE family protein